MKSIEIMFDIGETDKLIAVERGLAFRGSLIGKSHFDERLELS